MRFKQWRKYAIDKLQISDNPKYDADILLCFITNKSYSYILAFNETKLTLEQEHRLEQLLVRRASNEPIAYIIGKSEFWSLTLEVSPVTLIPRIDTEYLVEKALNILPNSACEVLDLGTGTGAIILALASELPNCRFTGVDYLENITALAWRNASRLKLHNVSFLTGNWFAPVVGRKFLLIVSNPPYIDKYDPHLLQRDISYEPFSALIAPDNGLAYLSYIIRYSSYYLINNGWLIIEHGWQQGKFVRQMFQLCGFTNISTHKDYGNNERITLGKMIYLRNFICYDNNI
ncbi:Release factor glutamine methyltransferase [Candidatus Profftia lariciata]|uniref:peptide chain release factor N(5)-glutamine methyltransferase n=1 Tax=Candidatus Profftia lariciata TaxID=1987921 RepID=UPI001D007B99|nr:peptide chain release factor N(5)-glutamine methyltransferase [Candidatus Profftia lariciata]UDG81769.1 Release factor glutamine methyltransferase [Candidatus Profftia lariciata]